MDAKLIEVVAVVLVDVSVVHVAVDVDVETYIPKCLDKISSKALCKLAPFLGLRDHTNTQTLRKNPW